MSTNIEEQRKEKRIHINFPASLYWLDHSGREITDEAFTTTLSNSGASLVTNYRPPVGKRVKVTLDMGGLFGSSIAEVKWTESTAEGFRIGVSFKSEEGQANA
jgi:hypothetical protein